VGSLKEAFCAAVGGVVGRQLNSADIRGSSRCRWLEVRHCATAGQSLGPADTRRATHWPRQISLHNQHKSDPQQACLASRHRSVGYRHIQT